MTRLLFISPNSKLHPFLRNGLWGYIDDEGNEIIANIYKEVSEFSEFNDVAAVRVLDVNDNYVKLL